ncbi:MAG: hypothetical protein ACI85O_001729 [Saprospiraceae bacterium]|jgi:hypothetical protein
MQSQDFSIMLGNNDFVKAKLIAPSEMQLLKVNLIRIENVKHSGVSRTFENEEREIILEFYNEVGLKLKSKDDLSNLQKTSFNTDYNNKIRYSTKLSEEAFSEILSNVKTTKTGKGFEFFGKFYAIEQRDVILWKGENIFSGSYFVLSTLHGLDYELEHLLKKPTDDDRFLRDSNLKEKGDEKVFKIRDGKQENIDFLVAELSGFLNIDVEQIDFSVESLNAISISLQWNDGNYSNGYMMTLSYYYLAEMLVINENFEYEDVNDYFGKTIYDLRYKGKSTLLQTYLHDSFIDSPLPQIKPAYSNTIFEMKGL